MCQNIEDEKFWEIDFHGNVYNVTVDVSEGSEGYLIYIEVEQIDTNNRWSAKFPSEYVEEITQKAGNFKKFEVFHTMLKSSLSKTSESVFVDLLTYADLELLKARKSSQSVSVKENVNNNPNSSSNSCVNLSKHNNKRYMILTYSGEFDRVHYPLPLQFQEVPSIDSLQRTVNRLRNKLKAATFETIDPPVGEKGGASVEEIQKLRQQNSNLLQRIQVLEQHKRSAVINSDQDTSSELLTVNARLRKQVSSLRKELEELSESYETLRVNYAKEITKYKTIQHQHFISSYGPNNNGAITDNYTPNIGKLGNGTYRGTKGDSELNALRRKVVVLERQLRIERNSNINQTSLNRHSSYQSRYHENDSRQSSRHSSRHPTPLIQSIPTSHSYSRSTNSPRLTHTQSSNFNRDFTYRDVIGGRSRERNNSNSHHDRASTPPLHINHPYRSYSSYDRAASRASSPSQRLYPYHKLAGPVGTNISAPLHPPSRARSPSPGPSRSQTETRPWGAGPGVGSSSQRGHATASVRSRESGYASGSSMGSYKSITSRRSTHSIDNGTGHINTNITASRGHISNSTTERRQRTSQHTSTSPRLPSTNTNTNRFNQESTKHSNIAASQSTTQPSIDSETNVSKTEKWNRKWQERQGKFPSRSESASLPTFTTNNSSIPTPYTQINSDTYETHLNTEHTSFPISMPQSTVMKYNKHLPKQEANLLSSVMTSSTSLASSITSLPHDSIESIHAAKFKNQTSSSTSLRSTLLSNEVTTPSQNNEPTSNPQLPTKPSHTPLQSTAPKSIANLELIPRRPLYRRDDDDDDDEYEIHGNSQVNEDDICDDGINTDNRTSGLDMTDNHTRRHKHTLGIQGDLQAIPPSNQMNDAKRSGDTLGMDDTEGLSNIDKRIQALQSYLNNARQGLHKES